ncbi:MAG TPA: hypothetical protein VKF62_08365, partial [Planctomycetota bacterium]|nr:hypothetical protein [Planctomycetota bacterium]
AGTYVVWASGPDLAPGHSGEIVVESAREAECTVRLERGVEVRIRATGPEGPVPLDDDRVRIVGDREIGFFVRSRLAPLPAGQDATGVVRRLLSPGEYRLIVEDPSYSKVEQGLVVGTTSPQEVTVVLSK